MTLEEVTQGLFLAQISMAKAKKYLNGIKTVKKGNSVRLNRVLELLVTGILNPKEANTEILDIWNEGR